MIDREKVASGLRHCLHYNGSCLDCPYDGPNCQNDVLDEALTLLKEQEAVKPKTGHWIESKCLDECFWVCSECNFQSEAIAAPKLYKYCPNCGSAMMNRR